MEYHKHENEDIEVRVNFEQPGAMVEYRLLVDYESEEWQSTPFQTCEFNTVIEALNVVDAWLEG